MYNANGINKNSSSLLAKYLSYKVTSNTRYSTPVKIGTEIIWNKGYLHYAIRKRKHSLL